MTAQWEFDYARVTFRELSSPPYRNINFNAAYSNAEIQQYRTFAFNIALPKHEGESAILKATQTIYQEYTETFDHVALLNQVHLLRLFDYLRERFLSSEPTTKKERFDLGFGFDISLLGPFFPYVYGDGVEPIYLLSVIDIEKDKVKLYIHVPESVFGRWLNLLQQELALIGWQGVTNSI